MKLYYLILALLCVQNLTAQTLAEDELVHQGLKSFAEKKYELAYKFFSDAIKLNPKSDVAFFDRGTTLGVQKKYDDAISDYSESLRINPNNVKVYYARGISYKLTRKYFEALEDFTMTLKRDIEYKKASTQILEVGDEIIKQLHYAHMDVFYEAARDATQRVKGSYDYNKAKSNFDNKSNLAIVAFGYLIKSDYAGYYYRGKTFWVIDNNKLAKEDFTKYISLNPKYAGAYYYRALVNQKLGNKDLAIADCKMAIKLEPGEEQFKKELSEILNGK